MKLVDICNVIRSKNSGPFELTFDIIFKSKKDFDYVCERKIINEDIVCSLYKIRKEDIINIVGFNSANAIKITIKRPIASGTLGEGDVYGAQQHVPLLNIEI